LVWLHSQKLGHSLKSQQDPYRTWHEAALRVGEHLRVGQVDRTVADPEIGLAGGKDVLHPLDVGTVGEGEDVAVAVTEDIHGRVVRLAGRPSAIADDGESGYAVREVTRQRIDHTCRERTHEPDAGTGRRRRFGHQT
jgi:hypothetical protein